MTNKDECREALYVAFANYYNARYENIDSEFAANMFHAFCSGADTRPQSPCPKQNAENFGQSQRYTITSSVQIPDGAECVRVKQKNREDVVYKVSGDNPAQSLMVDEARLAQIIGQPVAEGDALGVIARLRPYLTQRPVDLEVCAIKAQDELQYVLPAVHESKLWDVSYRIAKAVLDAAGVPYAEKGMG